MANNLTRPFCHQGNYYSASLPQAIAMTPSEPLLWPAPSNVAVTSNRISPMSWGFSALMILKIV
ncbi:hypothetical protein C8J36_11421 [Rhizobium sp. PP-F2F-G48]|nr:hypothetical protein C8J36_11421 [Rhizobium sp. PP-F2F-G48]